MDEGRCQYMDVTMGGFAMAMAKDMEFGQQVLQRLSESEYRTKSNEDNVRYLGRRMEWGGLKANRLIWEFWQATKFEAK
jgi:hypothetical protein